MNKKILLLALLLLLPFLALRAQELVVPEGFEIVDSLVFVPLSAEDTTISGQTIYSVMSGNVSFSQPAAVQDALARHIENNAQKQMNGYRIRIFFDNKQTARGDSEAAVGRFKAKYPGYAAYRTFTNPFVKVTVGDFRTHAEALAALRQIKVDCPSAFIVRERFRYPALGDDSFRVDTIRIVRRQNAE